MTRLLLRIFISDPDHTDSPCIRTAIGNLAGVVGLLCNAILFLGKLFIGLIAGSVAIVADAINNLSDAASSLIVVIGFRLSRKPADKNHPYGHARFEYLSGLAVAALILLIGAELIKSSVEKILHPMPIDLTIAALIILIGSILLKLWMSLFYRALGRSIQSTVLLASSADSRNDVISTSAVLVSCLIDYFTAWNVDGIVGLAVALFILVSGWGIAKDTISPLLGTQADEKLVQELTSLILSHEKILDIHDLLVHDYGPGQCFASVHAELSCEEDPLVCHDIIDDIERDALRELSVHLVIHYDPVVINDPEMDHIREHVLEIICAIDSRLSMHDFRLVRGAVQTKLIFDLEVPYSSKMSPEEIKCQIDDQIQELGHNYHTVIDFDYK